jgi:hypothetical protein
MCPVNDRLLLLLYVYLSMSNLLELALESRDIRKLQKMYNSSESRIYKNRRIESIHNLKLFEKTLKPCIASVECRNEDVPGNVFGSFWSYAPKLVVVFGEVSRSVRVVTAEKGHECEDRAGQRKGKKILKNYAPEQSKLVGNEL